MSRDLIGSQEHPNFILHTTCLRVIFGDIFRLDVFLAGEALGDTEALGESSVLGDGALDGVLVGVLGDGVLLGEL